MTASSLPPARRADRLAAMAGYVMFALAPFTLGGLALIALALAYARKGGAEPVARSHFERQIRSFWLDLLLVGLGLVCGAGALAAGFGAALEAGGVHFPWRYDAVHIGAGAVALLAIWGLLWIWGLFGLIVGSILGLMRLASGRPAGKTRSR